MAFLLKFFSLTYAVSWTCFIAAAALSGTSTVPASSPLRVLLLALGTFAPSLVALALTASEAGRAGAEALLRPLLESRVGGRWYLFAIAYMLAIKLAVALLLRMVGWWPRFDTEALYAFPLAVIISTPVQAGEEIGWRGCALPRLAERYGFARASLVLGLGWACWHLPILFVHGHGNYGQSFPVFAVGGVALSVAMAWLYVHTQGSLLLVMLMHSAVNQAVGIVPSTVLNASNPLAPSSSLVAC
jgi:membrane protease YdiL (CAAX protease family)